jgi:hypothetical protein
LANTSQPVRQSGRPKLDVGFSKNRVAVLLPVAGASYVPITVSHGLRKQPVKLVHGNL